MEKTENLIFRVKTIVKAEYTDASLCVTNLADRVGVSTSYLSRYFRSKTGATLFSYIDNIRIARAKHFLRHTNLPVRTIVEKVGYNDINNFNRKFKAKTSKTPTAFRAESREDAFAEQK